MLRRWRGIRPRKSTRFDPQWTQGPQGVPFPGIYEPAGARPIRFPARPRRGKFIEPVWPQVPAATPVPALFDQAGARPRFAAKPRRGTYFQVPPTILAQVPPAFTATRAKTARGPARRGTFFPLVPATLPTYTPAMLTTRAKVGRGPVRRGAYFALPLTAPATPPAFVPPIVRPAARRSQTRLPRGQYLRFTSSVAPTWAPQNVCTRRPQARNPQRGTYFTAPPAAASPPALVPALITPSRRPSARHRAATYTTVTGVGAIPQVLLITGARAITRWSAREGENL